MATASDASGSAVTYQLTQAPTGMAIDAAPGQITWTPGRSQVSADAVVVQAKDAAGNTAQQSFTLTFWPTIIAPCSSRAKPLLGTTDEDTPERSRLTGTFINNGAGTTTITDNDADCRVGGIALVGMTGNGTWEYSLDDGTTFNSVGSVGETSALLAAQDAQLRYTPDGKNGETATITYRAWDTTGGDPGGQVDLSGSRRSRRRHGLQFRYRHRLAHRNQRERRAGAYARPPLAGKHHLGRPSRSSDNVHQQRHGRRNYRRGSRRRDGRHRPGRRHRQRHVGVLFRRRHDLHARGHGRPRLRPCC